MNTFSTLPELRDDEGGVSLFFVRGGRQCHTFTFSLVEAKVTRSIFFYSNHDDDND